MRHSLLIKDCLYINGHVISGIKKHALIDLQSSRHYLTVSPFIN